MNIATYRFVIIEDAGDLREQLHAACLALNLKGTVLLGSEGININLAGAEAAIEDFKKLLQSDHRFAGLTYRESFSADVPFKFLKVKLRKEIITMRRDEVQPQAERAPVISPQQLKQWLDEKRDITLLDTRNDYEVRFGTFENAEHFQLKDFSSFANVTDTFKPDKPVVTFCTGGIRCEKAALHLQNNGVNEVYQLDGGILNYFAEAGGAHYSGECFVFDQRVSVDSNLQETATLQCVNCYGPVNSLAQSSAAYIEGISCPACARQQIA